MRLNLSTAGSAALVIGVLAAGLATSLAAGPAAAQSSTDSAVESAEDAFGVSTPHDQLGVYDAGNVRGFSPGTAGNFRMEGMYIDIQGGLSSRVFGSETIRVGPAAQGYAFPAPTGIVDLQLKHPGDKFTVSPFISADDRGSLSTEIDFEIPLAGKKLALSAGVGASDNRYTNGGGSTGFNAGGVLRWRPSPGAELLTFANYQQSADNTAQGIFITTGNFLPPRIERGRYPGPRWAKSDNASQAFGTVGHVALGQWTLRGGLFRTGYQNGGDFSNLIFVQPGGGTQRQVFATPANRGASISGELRLSRRLVDGPRQHLITATLRGRSIDGRYGGGDLADLGPAPFNAVIDVPRPVFAFSALTDDYTRQLTGGLAYGFKWTGRGEVTAGLQRTRYAKRVDAPGLAPARGTTDQSLPYASAALTLTPKLSLYASFVRGLEDAGTAPGYAANANQVLPAITTRQYDGGVRWAPVKDTALIVGFFQITKPYIDLDQANRYGVLGTQVHRGAELSLTTAPAKDVRIVAGGVWLDPRVTASPLVAQPLGARPTGQPQLRTRFNINWTLPFAKAVTLDGYVNHDSGAYAATDNSVYAPGSTRIGMGGRYKFALAGKQFTARLALYNIFDAYQLIPVGNGVYFANTQRNVQAYLAAEF